MKLTAITMLAALAALAACEGKAAAVKKRDQQRELARLTVRKVAFEAYPQWAMMPSNSGRSCPALSELVEYLGVDLTDDPWGRPYLVRCGAELPAGALDVGITSLGADGRPGTDDDVNSWD
jgi:hypothetical protein